MNDYEPPDEWTPPTTWQIFRRRGVRAVLQMKLERICVSVIADMHRDARETGHNLARPDYSPPWWFKYVSKLEFWLR